ncbi:MAG: peptide chain release factor N(5)-glutamine methyltransferase [Bacteroidetes bacterium]|nr:peptide chain release factor N(5)-glutamine methyltransferase [Bacteroidota bacterium]
MTLKETEQYLLNRILLQYDYQEAKSIAKIALQFILKLNNLKYALNYQKEVESIDLSQLDNFINRLQLGEPIQYIMGEAHFMGYDFEVSPEVLIPRRETEELVALIIAENENKSNLSLLDIGTGSGCIAITLSVNFFNSKVKAIDLSEKALKIASSNAKKLNAQVEFRQANILAMESLWHNTFDIIVSNPPYVLESEKVFMHVNVLSYEPSLALFVDDSDPLLFYRKITLLAQKALNAHGRLYFEVNEKFGPEVAQLLQENNFTNIEIRTDMQGKNRIVRGEIKDVVDR